MKVRSLHNITFFAIVLLSGMSLKAQTSFTNSTSMTVPGSGSGNANPASPVSVYSSNITVSGMTGTVNKVTVTLNGLTHSNSADIDALLVGPTGAKIIFLSDINGSSGSITVTFDDQAGSQAANPLSNGTFRPTDRNSPDELDNFPSPAPAVSVADEAFPGFMSAGTATFASKFNGTDPNGVWKLFIVDDAGGDVGVISGGWTITISSGVPSQPTTTSIVSSVNPSFTTAPNNSVTFTSTTIVNSTGNPPPSGTVTFREGAVTLAGPIAINGSGQASFTTTTLGEGDHIISANYDGTPAYVLSSGSVTQIVNNYTTVNGNMYCNPGNIKIPNGTFTEGPSQPYPSNIYVSGVGGTISKVTVQLNGLAQTNPDDLDLLLVGPGGQNIVLLSDAGGSGAVSGLNITFDDAAASFLPDGASLSSGTFKPSNYNSGADSWPSPAPASSGNSLLSVFNGLSPNGTWKLFVFDDAGGDIGSIANGWCLTITTGSVPATNTTLTSTPNPSFTTAPSNVVTFTATVTSSGNPVTSGNVTFTEGFTTLAGPVNVNGSGQASFNTSSLAEGTHVVTATYNGNVNFSQSTGNTSQEVNTRTVISGGNMFCNPGSFTIPGGANIAAPASPYPSNIFVTGLGGNIAKATVKLTGLGHNVPDDIDIMLVNPGNQNITLMSDAGGTTPVSGLTLTFDDAAAGSLPDGPTLASGTFKPSNYSGGDSWPAPAPSSSGSTLLSSLNTAANGNWKLFVYDDASGDVGTISGGWCLTITTFPGVTTQPTNQSVCAGNTATFTTAGEGFPTPTVQWQVSTDNGMNWNNIGGATSTTLSFSTVIGDNGKKYRAVFTNANGSTNSNEVTLTVTAANPAFAYGKNGYCQMGADPTPTIYGTTGGTFSAPAQLSINSGTGTIDVSASTVGGPYTVTYNTGGACPQSSTFQVSIVNCSPTATLTDALIIDNGISGKADGGDRIKLTATITNSQAADYTNVQLNTNNDPRVTLVPGSFKSTPVAADDAYTATKNMLLTIVVGSGLIVNDFDDNKPGLNVTSFNATSVQGGTVTVSANGSFTYNPPSNYTGFDSFNYTITDSDSQTNSGVVRIYVQ